MRSRPKSTWDTLESLATEASHPATRRLDTMDPRRIVETVHRADRQAWRAVGASLPQITQAAELAARTLARGGRIVYVGAGTSGRLGVLDASECPPTFGAPRDRVVGIVAGGPPALRRSIEGAEDRSGEGKERVVRARVGRGDLVIGIAASRRTPFVLAALREARRRKAHTVFIHCNAAGEEEEGWDVIVRLPVGPEVLAGSTRMKSGTAQKMVLNMISTAAWVRQGKVFGNWMVDLQARSEKLRIRGIRLVVLTTGLERDQAARLISRAGGSVKLAIFLGRTGASARAGREALRCAGGSLRRALEAVGAPSDPFRPHAAASLRPLGGSVTVRASRARRGGRARARRFREENG